MISVGYTLTYPKLGCYTTNELWGYTETHLWKPEDKEVIYVR